MQWSKLKSRIKSFICPELKDKIDFHLTSYRKSHDGADKVWITVDGERVFSCDHYPYERAEAEAFHAGLNIAETSNLLFAKEVHRPKDFGDAMRSYLDTPVSEAINSANPLIKAFAIIDRRLGKRTLEKLKVDEADHTLVKIFFELRKRTNTGVTYDRH